MAQTLAGAIDWWARMRGDQAAVVLDGDTLSYRDYRAWSERVAAMLLDEGMAPGDRVAVCATNSLAYVALILGIVRAGGIFAPMNFRCAPREIAELAEATTPTIAFAGADQIDRLAAAGLGPRPMAAIDALRTGAPVEVAHDPDPDAAVVIVPTSGSTARPKGVVYTNRSVTAYAANWSVEEPSTRAGSRIIALAPLSTSAGFVQLMHYAVQGCTLFMMPRFEPLAALRLIERERITSFAAVPAFFEFIAALPEFAAADLSSIAIATAGGARVSRALLDAYKTKGVTIRQIYGQTEAGGNATMMPEHLALAEPEKCGWGGVFMDLRVVRPDGTDCAPDETGEILMRSPGMMRGYWNNPAETAKTLRDGWLHSGDLGRLDARGLLTFVDRMKDTIISGGLNISAAEVEQVVLEYAGIVEAVAIAAPDGKFGETVMVVYHAPAPIDEAELIDHCNRHLSNFKVPRYLIRSPQPLPRLISGKLSKPAIRQLYADAHERLERVR